MHNKSSTPSPTSNVAVETLGLTRHYGTLTALNHLDLTINRGDLFGFIGSNGAGKTTTLRILSTFLTPSTGTARILGHDIVSDANQVRRILGYMPDFFGVYKDMEVTEYLDFFAACYRISAAKREQTINDVLELVGLSEKKGSLIGALSRGMQQRIGLARVLVHDPEILLLDEPASGLDPRARIEMMAILQELQRLGKTILISSHILSELQSLCNRVAIIEKGSLFYTGPVQGVQDQFTQQSSFRLRVAENPQRGIELLRERSEIEEAEIEEESGQILVTLAEGQADGSVIAKVIVNGGLQLTELKENEMDLEDVFLQVTHGETQ
ncbi:MAG TPA: multidrug ABC transporter ATP-binding protein [Verrucomicrobiales bacterium]|nr:multidrug ABC transporter ATP-binding protein [Verrucomicrobiales bacterium]|tara:strand:+ start:379 stop:1353 length:975 start_codon:yes stop_codon:yes gene_type:complete